MKTLRIEDFFSKTFARFCCEMVALNPVHGFREAV